MLTLALTVTRHSAIRFEEIAGAATAVAGALLFIGGGMPLGRRGTQMLAGILLGGAGVLWVIALHWGTRGP